MNYLSGILKREANKFHIIHIRGCIDTTMTYKIFKSLKKFKGESSKGIALVINSNGGSPAQAYLIMKKIEKIRNKYNIPIYTFAEDYALSAAFYIHQQGDKRYCYRTSFLGGVGTSISYTKIVGFVQSLGIEMRDVSTSTSGFTRLLDPLVQTQDLTEQLQPINDYANLKFQELFREIYTARSLKMNDQQKNEFYEGQIFLGQKMLDFGMCDGTKYYEDVIKDDYPDVKLMQLSKKTKREQAIEFLRGVKSQLMMSQLSGQLKTLYNKIN